MSHIIVLMTTASREEAEKITHNLLKQKWIACANIVGPVSSLFWWKDKISQDNEFLVLMKTSSNLFEKLATAIKQMHSYEVPEIIAVHITKGEQSYMDWLGSSLRKGE
ncbi:MAG: divalent-cation tolerance protein CutA [Candidatus Bathyarchaeota archaeon]|nr:divalent-cation tolerance protein CutA [Candidatus Bathyarchaeota archaeon]